MKALAIIQARYSSQRLPGKVLLKMGDKPILQWVCERVKQCKNIQDFIIATSYEHSDDLIESFCKKIKVPCERGELNNVAERFLTVLNKKNPQYFIRINADSPFIDADLIDQGLSYLEDEKDWDIITNCFPKTFPKGQSVEIIKSEILKTYINEIIQNNDSEHFPQFFYKKYTAFKIKNFTNSLGDYSKINLCIDEEKDLTTAQKIFKYFGNKILHTKWHEFAALVAQLEAS